MQSFYKVGFQIFICVFISLFRNISFSWNKLVIELPLYAKRFTGYWRHISEHKKIASLTELSFQRGKTDNSWETKYIIHQTASDEVQWRLKLQLGSRKWWYCVAVLHRAVRKDFSYKDMCWQQTKRSEGLSHWDYSFWGKKIPGREDSQYKRLELETCLAFSTNSEGTRKVAVAPDLV